MLLGVQLKMCFKSCLPLKVQPKSQNFMFLGCEVMLWG